MKPEPSLTVISLGGGVQSSVMALMANEKEFGRLPDCAIFADTRWEPPSIYEHLTWPRDRLSFPPVRRGQRAKPSPGREGPHQPLRLPQIRRHTRPPEGTRRGGRRHRQAPVHRQRQDQAHQAQDSGDVGTQAQAARPRRNLRRAVARHLHRRGHTHQDLPRPVDDEPLPSNRGGEVPQRLPERMAGA